jgi:hypothetical protein
MQLDKEIYNMQKRINKKRSNGIMLEMMTSKITIDLNVLTPFMKKRVVGNLNRTLVVTIHMSEMRNENSYICK